MIGLEKDVELQLRLLVIPNIDTMWRFGLSSVGTGEEICTHPRKRVKLSKAVHDLTTTGKPYSVSWKKWNQFLSQLVTIPAPFKLSQYHVFHFISSDPASVKVKRLSYDYIPLSFCSLQTKLAIEDLEKTVRSIFLPLPFCRNSSSSKCFMSLCGESQGNHCEERYRGVFLPMKIRCRLVLWKLEWFFQTYKMNYSLVYFYQFLENEIFVKTQIVSFKMTHDTNDVLDVYFRPINLRSLTTHCYSRSSKSYQEFYLTMNPEYMLKNQSTWNK